MTRRLTQLGPCLMYSSGCRYRVSNDAFNLKGEISQRQNLQLSTYLHCLCLSLSKDAFGTGRNKLRGGGKNGKKGRQK
jgi:hypothetical protein